MKSNKKQKTEKYENTIYTDLCIKTDTDTDYYISKNELAKWSKELFQLIENGDEISFTDYKTNEIEMILDYFIPNPSNPYKNCYLDSNNIHLILRFSFQYGIKEIIKEILLKIFNGKTFIFDNIEDLEKYWYIWENYSFTINNKKITIYDRIIDRLLEKNKRIDFDKIKSKNILLKIVNAMENERLAEISLKKIINKW